MRRLGFVLWFFVFGLLPLWVSLILVVVGSIGASSDYWAAAPWVLFIAIPLCAVTLFMAAATYLAYARTKGDSYRKFRNAILCLVMQLAVVGLFWVRHVEKEADLKALQEAGRVLVERSELVARFAPPRFQVRFSSSMGNSKSFIDGTFIYGVRSIDNPSDTTMLAYVAVTGGSAIPELRLKCVISERARNALGALIDPCQSEQAFRP